MRPGYAFATEATFHTYTRRDRGQGDFDREVLSFSLGDELYGIDILRIREILKPKPVTEVPRAPAAVPGIISVRGLIIPLVDLRLRLRLRPAEEPGKHARVLIVTAKDELFGLAVDRVYQVVRMRDEDVEPPPTMVGGEKSEYLAGIGRPRKDEFVILLNLDTVLALGQGGRR